MSADGSAFGIVGPHLGEDPDRFLLELRGVPLRTTLKPGTLIVSSGLGGVYPRGIPIGVVQRELPTSEVWAHTYLLRPAVLPADMSAVMILHPQRAGGGVDWCLGSRRRPTASRPTPRAAPIRSRARERIPRGRAPRVPRRRACRYVRRGRASRRATSDTARRRRPFGARRPRSDATPRHAIRLGAIRCARDTVGATLRAAGHARATRRRQRATRYDATAAMKSGRPPSHRDRLRAAARAALHAAAAARVAIARRTSS